MILTYKFIDGAHFFSPSSPLGWGLCVAHPDIHLCFKDIEHQLRVLLKENHKIEDVNITISLLPEEFLADPKKLLYVQVITFGGAELI